MSNHQSNSKTDSIPPEDDIPSFGSSTASILSDYTEETDFSTENLADGTRYFTDGKGLLQEMDEGKNSEETVITD